MKTYLSIVGVLNALTTFMPCVLSSNIHTGHINSNEFENVTDPNQGPKIFQQDPFSIICPGEFPKTALVVNEIRFLYMIEATNSSVISIIKRGIVGELAARSLPCLEDNSDSPSPETYSLKLDQGDSSGIIGFDSYPGVTTYEDSKFEFDCKLLSFLLSESTFKNLLFIVKLYVIQISSLQVTVS